MCCFVFESPGIARGFCLEVKENWGKGQGGAKLVGSMGYS